MKITRAQLEGFTRDLTDKGKIMEAGWIGFRHMVIDEQAQAIQLQEMRMAFMAGAQHLFSSIMVTLEPDKEPTANDLRRMSMIHQELESFGKELELRAATPGGNA